MPASHAVARSVRRWAAALAVAAVLVEAPAAAAPPAGRMGFWSEPRRGANGGPTRVRPEWFAAAAAAGIEFVRLRPDQLPASGRDFLIGDADHYRGLPERDVALLRAVLDHAHAAGLDVVLTMFSLPGCRWRQHNHGRDDHRLWRDEAHQRQALRFWRDLAARLRDHPAIVAWNPLNEPHPERAAGIHSPRDPAFAAWHRRIEGTTFDVNRFNRRMVAAIREVDPDTPILLDGWFHADPAGFAFNQAVADSKTLYALHNLGPWEFAAHRVNQGRFAYPERMPSRRGAGTARWTRDSLRAVVGPVRDFARRHRLPPHRIVASEFWCDRRVEGAAAYLEDEIRIFEEAGWHWAFYEFRPEGGFTGLDYEVPADARFGERYWTDAEAGKDVEAMKPRGETPIWTMLRRELARR